MKKCNKYIVNPQNGIVVGELTREKVETVWDETSNLKIKGQHNMFPYIISQIFKVVKDIDEEYKPFKAVARCRGGDEFSEETGKKIVDLKVNYKYHMVMAKKYRQIIRELRKILRQIEKLEQKHYNKYQQIDEKLAEFL